METSKDNQDLLTPQEYFDKLKQLKHQSSSESLDGMYEHCEGLLRKYIATGQARAAERLVFTMEVIQREHRLVEMGITTFVYKDAIEDYIENVADKAVKLIELRNFVRDVPDGIAAVVAQVKDIFDEFYVLFTDYTGKEERRVEKERRAKDPIIFGCFASTPSNRNGRRNENRILIDRFYYLGDWEDEYCDLTFDKMLQQMEEKDRHPARRLFVPGSNAEILEMAKELIATEHGYQQPEVIPQARKEPFFKRVKTAINIVKGDSLSGSSN